MPSEPLLRPYQEKLVEGFRDAITAHQRIVVSCPTGSGKTVLALYGFIPHLPKPVAWFTHRRELAKQVRDHGLGISVGMIQAGPIHGAFQSVVIDEGHHVCASQYRQLTSHYQNAFFAALTATPYRMDGQGLGSCGFTKILYGPDIMDLTEQGFLCPARVFLPKSESQTAWATNVAAAEIQKCRFRKAIVYCRSVNEAKALAKALTGLRISAACVDGATPEVERDAIVGRFKETNRLKVLCNHTIFTEGSDIPDVDLVVLNRLTESRCLWKQMVGRGLRPSAGKTHCTVLDLAGNGVLHGSIYDQEIYDLTGHVDSTRSRELRADIFQGDPRPYDYSAGEELKEWKPQPKPVRIIENLQKLRQQSPLLRLRTA